MLLSAPRGNQSLKRTGAQGVLSRATPREAGSGSQPRGPEHHTLHFPSYENGTKRYFWNQKWTQKCMYVLFPMAKKTYVSQKG